MTAELTNWITEYGYWATFFGAMIEGETAAFLSGVAAHNQLLYYPWVMLFAALGGIVSDNVLFYVGYFAGSQILPKFHRHQKKINRVQQLIRQHENFIIIAIRFAYGLRTVGPIIIGASKVNPFKFFILNILGGALWGVIIVSCGYFISSAILALPIHSSLTWFLLIIIAVVLFIFLRRQWKK
ncbi:DedA family protein [Providencia manganoxydans]|uniref:DedA family protein n=1 Tax=Providencia TaxID=586 RepID=UPI00234A8394|nr:DedA family protein [Providencia sp. PROV266]